MKKSFKIIEKPKKTKSNLAVIIHIFLITKSYKYSKKLKPSKRKEIEIIDLLNIYKKKKIIC